MMDMHVLTEYYYPFVGVVPAHRAGLLLRCYPHLICKGERHSSLQTRL